MMIPLFLCVKLVGKIWISQLKKLEKKKDDNTLKDTEYKKNLLKNSKLQKMT